MIVGVIVISFVLLMPLRGEDVLPRTTITSALEDNGSYVQNGGSIVSRDLNSLTPIEINVTGITADLPPSMHPNPIAHFECTIYVDGKPFKGCPNTNNGTRLTVGYKVVPGQHYKLAVRAVDTQGIKDPNPATFSWIVITPQQATQKLINNIFNLPKDVTTSLVRPLNATVKQLNRDIAPCNQLNVFLNQLNARQTNGQLTLQQAAYLIQQATAVKHAIRCSNSITSTLKQVY